MPPSKEELGKLIKKARNHKSKIIGKKFTQKDLAQHVNKSRSFIGDIEAGRTYPSYILLTEIANACEVNLEFFNYELTNIDKFIQKECCDCSDSEKEGITNTIKNDDNIKVNDLYETCIPKYFDNAQCAIKFILEQPALMAYGGYDLEDMNDDEILELANDMLLTLKVSLEKRKIKNK